MVSVRLTFKVFFAIFSYHLKLLTVISLNQTPAFVNQLTD